MSAVKTYWKCPLCNKEFAKPNQSHKCEVVAVEELFVDKNPAIWDLYQYFIQQIQPIGEWKVTTSKKAITIYAANRVAFMGIEVKRKWLDIWFALDSKWDEFPIYKILQASPKKFGHFVRLYDAEDVSQVLVNLLTASYRYTMEK